MPCHDPGWPRSEGRALLTRAEERTLQASARVNEVTALLCVLCRTLEDAGWDEALFDSVTPSLRAWWEDHKRHDAQRAAS